MPRFSKLSESRLMTCDARLQDVLREAIREVDFSVICGHRGEDEQNEAYRLGRSTKQWPHSHHNQNPSLAVDIAPYVPGVRLDWDDEPAFARLAGYVERVAHEMGHRIRWGGDFNGNWRTADERFVDMVHFELLED